MTNRIFPRLPVAALLSVLLGTFTTPVSAEESCWELDGATLHLSLEGAERVLRYEGPPAVLSDLGVEAGDLLFRGRETDGALSGTVRSVSPDCPGADVSFPVEGQIHGGRNRITLRGPRPLLSQCRPDGTAAAETLVLDRRPDC